jgi:metallo-beta-lactamase family protein
LFRRIVTLEFLGAAGTVTGSKYCVEIGGRRFLIDCGLYQGQKDLRLRNWDRLPIEPASVETVLLTHAHIDHSGYLPRFTSSGFRGQVIATRGTADLARLLLPDSGRLQEEEAGFHLRHGTSKHHPPRPLYTEAEAVQAASRIRGVVYDEPVSLGDGVSAVFRRAGHILGSSMILLTATDGAQATRLVFSGDVGRYNAPILPDPAPLDEADYILVESTYGDRVHDPAPVGEQLRRVILSAVERGGTIIVPAFAIGRTQEIMYHLVLLEDAGQIPQIPVYIDSPMAVSATALYCAHPEDLDEDILRRIKSGDCPLESRAFTLARTVNESRRINDVPGPALIISSSGMATGGRVLHHLRQRLPLPETTVLLVGYQAEGTRGRRLAEGARSVRIFGEDVPVRAHVETVHGLSAHADADGLLRWLSTAEKPPRRVFLIHGEPAPAATLAERIRRELGWDATVPAYRERVQLA